MRRAWPVARIILVVVIVIGLPLMTFALVTKITDTAHHSDVKACEKRNELRTGIVSYIDSLGEARRRSAEATVASPTATANEKQAAVTNLQQLAQAGQQARDAFRPEDCTQV